MSIYIMKDGEKRKVNISATDVQLLDIDGNFKNKNLEDALKELISAGGGGNVPDNIPTTSSGTFKPVFIDAETGESVKLRSENVLTGNYTIIGNICFFTINTDVIIDEEYEYRTAAIKLPFNTNISSIVIIKCSEYLSEIGALYGRIYEDKLYIENSDYTIQYMNLFIHDYNITMNISGFYFIQQ